jgi:large subunit ribosomal protein L25
MAEIRIKAWRRTPGGKGVAKKLRATGRIPAVVYSKGAESLAIELDGRDVHGLTHGGHAGSLESVVVWLEVQDGGESSARPALITEIQHHPIKGNVLHMDFHQVSLTEKIHARIPVITVGDSPGVATGGILEHLLRELEVRCLAMDLPEQVEVSISELGLGQAIHVRDIKLGDKVEILNDQELTVVSVTEPRVIVEEEAAEKVAEPVEPEVITEKKREEAEKEEKGAEEKKGA